MISGIPPKAMFDKQPPEAQERPTLHGRDKKYTPDRSLEQPLQPALFSRKTAKAMGQPFESSSVYRKKAVKNIRSAVKVSGASKPVPQFIAPVPDITSHLYKLKDSARGKHIINLIKVLCESVAIAKQKHASFHMHGHLNALLKLALKASECESDSEAIYELNIWCCQQLPNLLGISFADFEVYKVLETDFLNCTEEEVFDYLLFIVKVSNACSVNNIPVTPCMLAFFDMRLCTRACANPFAILSFNPEAFDHWINSFTPRQKIGISIEEPFHIEAPYTEQLNELYWAEAFSNKPEGVSRQLTAEDMKHYLLHVLIPQDIKEELFPALTEASGTSSPTTSEQKIDFRKQFLFGEEFEFSGMDIATKNDMVRDDYKLKHWLDSLEQVLASKGIKDYTIKSNTHHGLVYEVWVTIGNWECKVFADEENLEVIATPYAPDQVFLINGTPYTPYQCFDSFIHDVARTLPLQGVSGHRHMDIRHCLNGDKELLFRLMVDMEHHSWLPRAFSREQQSKFFKYALQHADIQKEKVYSMIETVNSELKKPLPTQASGSFSDLCDIKNLLSCMYLWDHYGPCSMRHIEDEDHPPSIRIAPTSTVELRFLPCAQNGEESRLISELLIKRIEYLRKCKQERKPLIYSPVAPCDYTEDQNEAVIKQFVEFIREMGEEPAKYRSLLRIAVPAHCEHLFKPSWNMAPIKEPARTAVQAGFY